MVVYDIIPKNGHWEVYINGKFYCTADTKSEGLKDAFEHSETEE